MKSMTAFRNFQRVHKQKIEVLLQKKFEEQADIDLVEMILHIEASSPQNGRN
jgi:hypothetical protein